MANFPGLIMMRAGWSSENNQPQNGGALLSEPEIPMGEVLTIPCPRAFDTKKIVFNPKKTFFDTKTIGFDTKTIGFGAKGIRFDKKKMKTAVGTVIPAIETIASTIEATVFLIKIPFCGTKI
jgi:hypothetical protein